MTQVFVPKENVNDETVVVLTVYVESGTVAKAGDVIVDLETSKTNIAVCAPEDGMIQHNLLPNTEIEVGKLLFTVSNDSEQKPSLCLSQNDSLDVLKSNGAVVLSNLALQLANQSGVSLDGQTGWISTRDVSKIAENQNKPMGFDPTGALKAAQRMTKPQVIDETILASPAQICRIDKRKQAEIHNLELGNHAGTTSVIGVHLKVVGARLVKQHPLFESSITDLVVYEAAKLLKKYPGLNACYLNTKTWAAYNAVNFGWSFDSGKNLKVLAVKNADSLSLSDLHEEVMNLLELYESGKQIPMDLLTSSTVTVTDLTRTGAAFVFPLINGHQSMILGVVKSSETDFQVYASFDHRVAEGLEVSKFLSELKERVLSYYKDANGVALVACSVCDKLLSEELALGNKGFIKMIMKDGAEGALCRNCFSGF